MLLKFFLQLSNEQPWDQQPTMGFFSIFYETMFTEESAFFSDGLFITKLVGQLASGKFREAAFSFCGGLWRLEVAF